MNKKFEVRKKKITTQTKHKTLDNIRDTYCFNYFCVNNNTYFIVNYIQP